MNDLFGEHTELIPLQMPGAEVYYAPDFRLPRPPAELLQELIASTPWRAEEVMIWGKLHMQPRLIAWFGYPGMSYSYSGVVLDPLVWTPTLEAIKARVELIAGTSFNSVLLNYYRNNRDSMGMHSDDEPELGPRPTIASVSLGEERTLVFKHKTMESLGPLRLKLASGSLLLMQGDTQRNWKHGINKEERQLGPRVNLTFRRILSKLSQRSA